MFLPGSNSPPYRAAFRAAQRRARLLAALPAPLRSSINPRDPVMRSTCADVKPAKTLGPFEMLKVIGRGASATVYKARHKPSGKLAAVKVLPRLLGLEPAALERFRREFTVIRQLQH